MTASNSPEDMRLATCGPGDVTLYSRPGCHLCEEAKAAIAPLLRDFGAALHEVNIDDDSALKERYRWDIKAQNSFYFRISIFRFNAQLPGYARQRFRPARRLCGRARGRKR